MPVPVSSTNPDGKGISCHQSKALPSSGSIFSRLNASSAERALSTNQDVDTRSLGKQGQSVKSPTADTVSVEAPYNGICTSSEAAVRCQSLKFHYVGNNGLAVPGPPVLRDVNIELMRGSRLLLVGANGAGKTTLLKILAGKHMVPREAVQVLGEPPFFATKLTTSGALSYIGGNWERDLAFAGYAVPLAGDFPASQMLDGIPGADRARRQRLVEVLDIDESWRMHMVSDGQRRRVQIACGLLRPAHVLLLDEVTVDLDVLVREDLLAFLREETERRGATVVYITHIFDGLESWPSHIGFLANGAFEAVEPAAAVPEIAEGRLMERVEAFLRRHKAESGEEAAARAADEAYARNNGYAAGRMASTVAE